MYVCVCVCVCVWAGVSVCRCVSVCVSVFVYFFGSHSVICILVPEASSLKRYAPSWRGLNQPRDTSFHPPLPHLHFLFICSFVVVVVVIVVVRLLLGKRHLRREYANFFVVLHLKAFNFLLSCSGSVCSTVYSDCFRKAQCFHSFLLFLKSLQGTDFRCNTINYTNLCSFVLSRLDYYNSCSKSRFSQKQT